MNITFPIILCREFKLKKNNLMYASIRHLVTKKKKGFIFIDTRFQLPEKYNTYKTYLG